MEGMKKVLLEAVKAGIEVPAEIKALEERLNKEYAELEKENHTPNDTVPDALKRTMEILRLTSIPKNATAEDRARKAAEYKDHVHKTSDTSRARQLAKMNRRT